MPSHPSSSPSIFPSMVTERLITVHYLEPSVSRELLGKFPDNSAFGFDYSQSSIWSPLLPRARHASASLLSASPMTIRNVKAKFLNKKKKQHQRRRKQTSIRRNLEFSPIPSPKIGWKRVLKAAAKRFKVRGRSPLQMTLPTL